jgi:arsenite-transporting ATPase
VAQQIDAQDRLEGNWREIQDYFIQLMNWAGTETIQAEELTVIPALDEIFSLIDIRTHVESGAFDMLVVDCAPTAETLRLLSLPEIMNWYIERVFPVERRVVKTIRPIVVADDVAADRGRSGVRRGRTPAQQPRTGEQILTDEKVSSVRLVVNRRRW